MSQVNKKIWIFLSAASLFALIAASSCSNGNSKSTFNPDSGHPANWAGAEAHGGSAKAQPGSSGFDSCRQCHGSDFAGGISQITCMSNTACHGAAAPHPARPWRGARTHTTTHQDNANSCALCHTNGSNSSLVPSPPADPGLSPGCFNSTLCHGPRAVHPAGWDNPDLHGLSAKSAPTGSSGFSYCRSCHGSVFSGGSSLVSCLSNAACHGVAAPHSPAPWRGGLRTHTDTSVDNASVCFDCHRTGQAGTPGCFNNTLCHGSRAVHPAGWNNPDSHGPSAKGAPGISAGFLYCQSCHGSDFAGGITLITCLSNAACHGVAAPHSPAPWRGGLRTHTDTSVDNASVCFNCHRTGQIGTPGCFNNTLCHGQVGACGSCHGLPPNGTMSPNIAGRHALHSTAPINTANDCSFCHQGAGPGTLFHVDGTVQVSASIAYNSRSGTAAFNATSKACSFVSCHGGPRTQTAAQAGQNPPQSTASQTPHWITGVIDINTQCASCHVLGSAGVPFPTPEYNSYYSGRHYLHVYEKNRTCTQCHDAAKLDFNSNHFKFLGTPQMEGPASSTLLNGVNYNGVSCNPGGLAGCHDSKNW